MLLDPVLIVEVYSPLTEALDRGTKWAHYRTIPSLREYVLIAQDEISIERYVRHGDDWLYSTVSDPDGVLHLASLSSDVPVRTIYDRVTLPDKRVACLSPRGICCGKGRLGHRWPLSDAHSICGGDGHSTTGPAAMKGSTTNSLDGVRVTV